MSPGEWDQVGFLVSRDKLIRVNVWNPGFYRGTGTVLPESKVSLLTVRLRDDGEKLLCRHRQPSDSPLVGPESIWTPDPPGLGYTIVKSFPEDNPHLWDLGHPQRDPSSLSFQCTSISTYKDHLGAGMKGLPTTTPLIRLKTECQDEL